MYHTEFGVRRTSSSHLISEATPQPLHCSLSTVPANTLLALANTESRLGRCDLWRLPDHQQTSLFRRFTALRLHHYQTITAFSSEQPTFITQLHGVPTSTCTEYLTTCTVLRLRATIGHHTPYLQRSAEYSVLHCTNDGLAGTGRVAVVSLSCADSQFI